MGLGCKQYGQLGLGDRQAAGQADEDSAADGCHPHLRHEKMSAAQQAERFVARVGCGAFGKPTHR